MVPVSSAVKQAIMDTYGDYEQDQARYTAWAVRAVKRLTAETLRSGLRRAILNVNKNTNHAVLPCDFKEEFFVGFLNSCGEKVALNINPNIVNSKMIEEVACENECDKNCGCYPKQLCEDLVTTQVINKILIGDTYYDETVTSTLLPNGEYSVVTTTPYMNMNGGGVLYKDTKSYVTTFDVADCGCIQQTARNACRLENLCYDLYCCYCTSCATTTTDFGGYKIFTENNIIQFDRGMTFDKVYMEYRGFLPKVGNEYLIPEVAFETIVELTKYMSIKNKKGAAAITIEMWFNNYMRERGNMRKILGRMSISDILHQALTVPSFGYNAKTCNVSSARSTYNTSNTAPTVVTNTIYVPTPSGDGSEDCFPGVITTNGQEMEGGTTYLGGDPDLRGVPIRIYANAFNRMLREDEYTRNIDGGWTILTGVYGLEDEFDIFPKWCDANRTDLPTTVTLGARKLAVKVDGNAGSPVAGEYTFQHNDLIGATSCEDILVNKFPETVIDGDFTFDSSTGTITRTNQWAANDTAIINYIK